MYFIYLNVFLKMIIFCVFVHFLGTLRCFSHDYPAYYFHSRIRTFGRPLQYVQCVEGITVVDNKFKMSCFENVIRASFTIFVNLSYRRCSPRLHTLPLPTELQLNESLCRYESKRMCCTISPPPNVESLVLEILRHPVL